VKFEFELCILTTGKIEGFDLTLVNFYQLKKIKHITASMAIF